MCLYVVFFGIKKQRSGEKAFVVCGDSAAHCWANVGVTSPLGWSGVSISRWTPKCVCVCVCACAEYYYDQEEDRTDEEAEPIFSEDEAVTQRGLRRSQSVKMTRSRIRKDVSHRTSRPALAH